MTFRDFSVTTRKSPEKVKIERDDSSGVRRITLNGDQQKIVMATYLINQSITAYSSAKPVHEKLNVKRKGDDYKTDINNLSSGENYNFYQTEKNLIFFRFF